MSHQVFDYNARFFKLSFDRKLLSCWADELYEWLFCIHPSYNDENTFRAKEIELKQKLVQFIKQTHLYNKNSDTIAESFFNKLPQVHELLKNDLEALFNSDPAARSIDEVLYAYP